MDGNEGGVKWLECRPKRCIQQTGSIQQTESIQQTGRSCLYKRKKRYSNVKVSWESQLWIMLVLEILSAGIVRFEIPKYGGKQNDQEST